MTEEHQDDGQQPDGGDQGGANGDEVAKVRREAAGYRTKLREAEQKLEEHQGQIDAMRKLEAQRVAAAEAEGFRPLADGADLFREDTALDKLLDEDGTVSADKVRERVGALVE